MNNNEKKNHRPLLAPDRRLLRLFNHPNPVRDESDGAGIRSTAMNHPEITELDVALYHNSLYTVKKGFTPPYHELNEQEKQVVRDNYELIYISLYER